MQEKETQNKDRSDYWASTSKPETPEKAEWGKGITSWGKKKKQSWRVSSGFEDQPIPMSDGSQRFPADSSAISHWQAFLKCLFQGVEEIDA